MAPYATDGGQSAMRAACHSRHFLSGIHGLKRENSNTERNGVYNKVSRRHKMVPYAADGGHGAMRAACHSRHFLSGIHGLKRENSNTEREWGL